MTKTSRTRAALDSNVASAKQREQNLRQKKRVAGERGTVRGRAVVRYNVSPGWFSESAWTPMALPSGDAFVREHEQEIQSS